MNVYQIGVALSMTNGVSPVLAVIARDMLGLHSHINTATAALGRFRLALAGVAGIMGGVKIGEGLFDLSEKGAKLQHFETQFRAAGYSQVEVAGAVKEAWHQATTSANANVSETLMNIQHLTSITGSMKEALESIGAFNKMQFALASLKDDQLKSHFEGNHLQTYNAARAMEMLGKTKTPEMLDDAISKMTRTMISFRGLVDGTQYYTAMKNAGGMQAMWNDDFTFRSFPAMIQEMGAGRAANAVYMLQRGFGKGQVTQYSADAGIKYGLWNEDDKIFSNGRFTGMKANAVKGADLLNKNPYQWVGDVLLPTLAEHGIKSQEQISQALDELARNKTISQAVKLLAIDKMRQQIEKEARNVDKVPEDAAGILQKDDYSLAKKGVFTQFDNMMTALGRPLAEPAIKLMQSITQIMQEITKWASANPETILNIAKGLAILGSALFVGGVVALGAALAAIVGVPALVAAGIAALGVGLVLFWDQIKAMGTAVAGWAVDKWNAAVQGIKGIGTAISDWSSEKWNAALFKFDVMKQWVTHYFEEAKSAIGEAIQNIANTFREWIMKLPGMVADAIASAISSIGSSISNALSNLKSYLPGWMGGGPAAPATDAPKPQKMGAIMPPSGSAKQQLASAGDVYLDGDKVGRHLSRTIARNTMTVGSAAEFDGTRSYTPTDYAFG